MSEQKEMLVPVEFYLKAGIHIGTKFKCSYMESFIYKIRPDGLYILNLEKIDERIGLAANLLSNYNPEDILIVSRRENGWKGLQQLHKLTGIKVIIGRYPPGILTNPQLETFVEPKIIMVCDPWPDKNAVEDAAKIGVPIIALCDTNNQSNKIDLVIPCNNKGKKSVGIIFYLIAKGYMQKRRMLDEGQEFPAKLEDFVEE